MEDGPAYRAPGGVADDHGQGAAEGDACLCHSAAIETALVFVHKIVSPLSQQDNPGLPARLDGAGVPDAGLYLAGVGLVPHGSSPMGAPFDFICAAEIDSALRRDFAWGKILARRTRGGGQGPHLTAG